MGNVLAFPKMDSRRQGAAHSRFSPELEGQVDRVAELLADRAQRAIGEWQAQQGMPSEEAALVARLEALAGSRGDRLDSWTLYRLDALLTFAGWRDDHG